MFYLLQAAGENTYQYAWQDTSFRGIRKSTCPECGREVASMEYSGTHCLLTEGGAKYPDYLAFRGAGVPLFVISRRAADIFQENRLTGIEEFTPVQVVKEENGERHPLPETAPEYVLARITGKIDLDYEKMCLKKKKVCDACGGFTWSRQRMYPMYLDDTAWDGRDLCRVESIPGYVVFSKAAVELVKKYKLKGFGFQSL